MAIEVTHVDDAEELIRRIPAIGNYYKSINPIELSSTAFNAVDRQPSVDRRKMKTSLDDCKETPTDGLVMLIAHEVRVIEMGLVRDAKGNPLVDGSGKLTGEIYIA